MKYTYNHITVNSTHSFAIVWKSMAYILHVTYLIINTHSKEMNENDLHTHNFEIIYLNELISQ